jgi:hypothetical protein
VLLVIGYGAGLSAISGHAAAQPFDSQVREAIAVIEREAAPGDIVITLAPYDYVSIMNWLHAPLRVIGLAPHSAPLREQEEQQLARAVRDAEKRVWLIAPRIPPGDEAAYAERWLTEHGFVASQQWHGETRLLAFAPASDTPTETRDGAAFEGGIALESIALHDPELPRGRDLRVETTWRADEPVPTDYTIFVHLLTADGRAVSGLDGPPVNGYRPFASWQPGETITDRKGVPVPVDLPPGEYALEIGLYDPATGQRVRLANGEDRVVVTGLTAR